MTHYLMNILDIIVLPFVTCIYQHISTIDKVYCSNILLSNSPIEIEKKIKFKFCYLIFSRNARSIKIKTWVILVFSSNALF